MRHMSAEAYSALTNDAALLEQDSHGPKVLRLADGSFFKLFRRKRLVSSEAFYPYAKRFADNARALKGLDIPAPEIIQVYRIDHPQRTAVHYAGLPGITLRQAMQDADGDTRHALAEQFGCLLGKLHQKGVYFRSLHLGNVLLLPNGTLGLIDFADMHVERDSLSAAKRRRNIKHMQRYEDDRLWLFDECLDALAGGYARCSDTRLPLLQPT